MIDCKEVHRNVHLCSSLLSLCCHDVVYLISAVPARGSQALPHTSVASVLLLTLSSFKLDVPDEVNNFTASVGYLSVIFTWTPPSFLGVPPTLDPVGIIYYILDVRNDTDSVGGATVSHPTTTVEVNLTYPCEEYTATIFARNSQAGDGPLTMDTFTLNETS